MPEVQPPAPVPKNYYLGFNLNLDRQAIMNLLTLAQQAVGLRAKSVTICMTSTGGAPDQGLYAYEILSALPIPIFTHAIGTVQSAALTLFMAGERRTASPGTNFLFHETVFNPGGALPLRFDDLMGQAEAIEQNDRWSHQLMAKLLSKPIDEVAGWYRGQSMRDAEFALKNGVIQEVCQLVVPPDAEFVQVGYKF